MSDRLKARHLAGELAHPMAAADLTKIDEHRVIREAQIIRGEVLAKLLVGAARAVKAVVSRTVRAMQQAQMMRVLSGLDDRALSDIGVKRGDIPAYALGLMTQNADVPSKTVAAQDEARRAA